MGKINYLFSLCVIFTLIIFIACNKEIDGAKFEYSDFVPSHFPTPDIALENTVTEEKVTLGRKLFYDPILSVDSTISCASCHNPKLAFSDSVAFSLGANGALGTRNSPTLTNVVYQKRLLREGGLPSLEMQILVPIQEHNEFNTNILHIVDKLNKNANYKEMSKAAFGRMEVDAYVITRSISAFERVLLSGNSKYDQSINGKSTFNVIEQRGMDLFFSERTQCSTCHGTFLFTNQSFENNGLYETYKDNGRKRFTNLEEDEAKFKVPTLRNISITAPYMHDGSIKTLEEVIEHYNTGGKPHKNKSILVQPLGLNIDERRALIAFLKTLTDHSFINNKYFQNE